MLDNYLEKLKHKPEHVRRNTALVASGVITGIIVLIWAFSLGSRFGGGDKQAKGADPFAIIKNAFGEIIHRAKPETQSAQVLQGAIELKGTAK